MHVTSFTWPGIRCRGFCQLMVGGDLFGADSHFCSYACQAVNLVSGFLSHTVGLINEIVIVYCPPPPFNLYLINATFREFVVLPFSGDCHENTFIVASFYFVIAPLFDLYLIYATFRELVVLPFSGDCHENTFIFASFYFVIAPCLIYICYKRRFGSWFYFHFQAIVCN